MYSINKCFLFFLCFLFFSCTEHDEVRTIGEAEYYFDENLSSISLDANGNFWIGSETGDIINFKDNQQVSYSLGTDRIYKINNEIEDSGDTIFWLGIRNSGLQKWKKSKNKIEQQKVYKINFKKDRYSTYDFVYVDQSIYVATSQGFYSLDRKNKSDSLILIYPSADFLSQQNGYSFTTHNIAKYQDSLLLTSTQDGVFILNTKNNKNRLILKDYSIKYVSVYNDTIYSISNSYLYLHKINGEFIEKIEIGNTPALYYQTKGIHYLIASDEIILSKNLKDFLPINIRRTIPLKARSIILPDTINNFTYLLTENAVWKIPDNIDVFKSNKSIKLSCSNIADIYYLTSKNELYVQNKNSNKAKWIYTFPSQNQILWMDIIGSELYFYNADNVLQKMKISNSWIGNILFHSSKSLIQPKEKIIYAKIKKAYNEPIIYLGIQDGMLILENNRVDTIKQLSNTYITSMFGHTNTERLYLSSLNDGVLYINQENEIKEVPQTDSIFFIKDIITTNTHNSNLIMLTNQQLISQITRDTIKVKGYKKLIYVNDTLFYAFPEFGIQKFIIAGNKVQEKGILYKDIRFNTQSSFSYDNKLVLGSNIGSFIINTNEEKTPVWIKFGNAVSINLLLLGLFLLVILAVASIIIILLVKKQSANTIQITKRKNDLQKRVEDLINFYSILDEVVNVEVIELEKLINGIDISANNKNEINQKLEEYSLRIGKLNRKVALLIPKKLEDQIRQIHETESFDKPLLLKQSYEVQTNADIEKIKDQVLLNEQWLKQRAMFFEEIKRNLLMLSGCVEIEGVNNKIYNRLNAILKDDKYLSFTELTKKYLELEKEILKIENNESRSKIENYINEINVYIDLKVKSDSGLAFVQEYFNKNIILNTDNITLLKKLNNIQPSIVLLKHLDKIKNRTKDYKDAYDSIINDNNEQVNKKFDKELASYIADQTANITYAINTEIADLYNDLSVTDKLLLTDVLKISNIEGQHAKVLAMLIANMKVKRSLIPGMLGIYGNLNPVISRLTNDRIKVNENILRETLNSDKHISVFVYLVLKLID